MRRSCFGTPATGEAWFNIRLDPRDGGQVEDWPVEVVAASHPIPYSDPPRADVEIIGVMPTSVTWRLWLTDRDAYRALAAKVGTSDTLSLPAGIQSHTDSETIIGGEPYDVLPYTTLLALRRPARLQGGHYEVDAIFQRVWDPATGKAVPS